MMDRTTFEMRVREMVTHLAAEPDLPFAAFAAVLRSTVHNLDLYRAQEIAWEELRAEWSRSGVIDVSTPPSPSDPLFRARIARVLRRQKALAHR